jgi:hypothetical protein
MISGPAPDDPATRLHFTYDAWNRLVAVFADDNQTPGSPGSLIASYEYDGRGYRIQKTVAAGNLTTHFFYNDNWQLLETRSNTSSAASEQYVWDPRYIDAPVLRQRDTDSDGSPDETLYYTSDALFNVTALIDAISSLGQ